MTIFFEAAGFYEVDAMQIFSDNCLGTFHLCFTASSFLTIVWYCNLHLEVALTIAGTRVDHCSIGHQSIHVKSNDNVAQLT